MKRLFLTIVAIMMAAAGMQAVEVEINGVKYDVVTRAKEAIVIAKNPQYTGRIVIPASIIYEGGECAVTSIGNNAFNGCTGLTSVTIPSSVSTIGGYAFYECTGLTSVTIPSSVTTIGEWAFGSCDGLTSVHITDIAAWCKIAFTNWNSNPLQYAHHLYINGEEITDLVIPSSVTAIGEKAFYGCTGLTSVTIPSSVTNIGGYAFYECTGLTSVTIPSSVTAIGEWAFDSCDGLTSVHITDIAAWCKIVFATASNPLRYAHHLYLNGEKITDLVIPSSVTTIGDYTFEGCTGLTSVTIPSSVTTIGLCAFRSCSGLTSVIIPSSVSSIGVSAFVRCTGLTSVTISEGVNTIGEYAFGNCTGLTSVTISEGVTTIGQYAFNKCTGLTSVTIPSSVTNIRGYTFYECTGLTSVTISEGVNTIGEHAFANCTGLTSVTIPSSVTAIENWAFSGCTGLTSVHITDIAAWCKIVFAIDSNPLQYAHHLYINGEEITDLVIPSSVTAIGYEAFIYSTGMTSVTISEGVNTIGEHAFANCTGLTAVTIPSSVISIGRRAFEGCTGLTSVTSNIVTPFFLNGNEFDTSLKTNGTLYIPAGTRQAYVEKGWNMYFANIVEMEDGDPIWLSIIDAEQGRTDLKCKTGETYTFRFKPAEGWRVHSVTFRGADVTSWLTGESEFTTPAISTSTELVVTYEQYTVDVKAISNNEAKARVLGVGGEIIVKNAQAGTPIAVYDLNGRMIAKTIAVEGATRVAVTTTEKVVVVKVGERSVKVAR